MTLAQAIDLAALYLAIGAGVAAFFLAFAIGHLDEDADGAHAFRPLLAPGVLLLWPLVLWRWIRIAERAQRWPARYAPPRAIHAALAAGLFLAVVAFLATGFLARQNPQDPGAHPAVLLESPEAGQ